MQEEVSIEETLRRKFPEMKPVTTPPTLGRINGIGLSLFGSRDRDAQTNTYVKSWGFTVFFIPILALGAYRVADAPGGGWYFLGKEKSSGLAKIMNLLVIALIGSFVFAGMNAARKSSPEYRAGKQLAAATEHYDAGRFDEASDVYLSMVKRNTPKQPEVRTGLQESLDAGLRSSDSGQQLGAMERLVDLPATLTKSGPFLPDVENRALRIASEGTDPLWSAEILDHAASLSENPAAIREQQVVLLEKGVAANPTALEPAERLALVYESQGRSEDCLKILEPLRDELGTRQGARILGRAYLEAGDNEKAHSLLTAYLKPRMRDLKNAGKDYEALGERLWQRWLTHLDEGKAPDSWYRSYEKANEEGQNQKVNDFIMGKIEGDISYQRAMKRFMDANENVPVAIDLGLVQLNRAQELPDPKAKKDELEAAEKTFLSIQSYAGESDEYRMFLGQVYSWLGKEAEAKDLFDRLLESNKRSPEILYTVAATMRDLGDAKSARDMLEEGYEKSRNVDLKRNIAALRANVQIDLDDQIKWLERGDTSSPQMKANLLGTKAQKDIENGDTESAIKSLKEATTIYEKLPEGSITFNNHALVLLDLYQVTADPAYTRRAAKLLEQASALSPSDTILMGNAASTQLNSAMIQLVSGKLDQKALTGESAFSQYVFLYKDDASRKSLIAKLGAMEDFQSSSRNYERAMLLAPKSKSNYSRALLIHGLTMNEQGLEKLNSRLREVSLNFDEEISDSRASYAGEYEADTVKSATVRLAQTEKLVKAASSANSLTGVYAAATHISAQLDLMHYQKDGDIAKIVAAAKQAHNDAPSSGTHSVLVAAQLMNAMLAMDAKSPQFAKIRHSARNVLGPKDFTLLALHSGGQIAETLKSLPEFKLYFDLELQSMKNFSERHSPEDWALIAAVTPAEAPAIADNVATNSLRRHTVEISEILSPLSSGSVTNAYFHKLMAGDSAGAKKVYEDAIARGIPLPKFE